MALDYFLSTGSLLNNNPKFKIHASLPPLLPREHITKRLLHKFDTLPRVAVSYPSTCFSCNTTENYPQWVAAIAGQMGEDGLGFSQGAEYSSLRT